MCISSPFGIAFPTWSHARTRPIDFEGARAVRVRANSRDRPDRDERAGWGHAMAGLLAGGWRHHASRSTHQPSCQRAGCRPAVASAARGRGGSGGVPYAVGAGTHACMHACMHRVVSCFTRGALGPAGVGCDRSSRRAGHRGRATWHRACGRLARVCAAPPAAAGASATAQGRAVAVPLPWLLACQRRLRAIELYGYRAPSLSVVGALIGLRSDTRDEQCEFPSSMHDTHDLSIEN